MTQRAAEPRIEADLECQFEGEPCSVRTVNGDLVINVPHVATAWKMLSLAATRGGRRKALWSAKRMLDRLGLAAEIHIAGQPVARLGYGVVSGRWQWLGLPRMKLQPVTIVRVVTRRR